MIKGVALTTDEVKDGFDWTDGRCVDLDGKVTDNYKSQPSSNLETCKEFCKSDVSCSAFEHSTRNDECTTFSDTIPLIGNGSTAREQRCYFKLNEER
jgi:hypothetical protein